MWDKECWEFLSQRVSGDDYWEDTMGDNINQVVHIFCSY